MLHTKEADYALRILRNLNMETPTSISDIVDHEDMTTAIAYKVSRKLEAAGVVKSIRGNAGGYILLKDLNNVSLFDVYEIMDPDAKLNACLSPKESCPLNTKKHPCAVHKELERVQEKLDKELQRKSLVQIIKEGSN